MSRRLHHAWRRLRCLPWWPVCAYCGLVMLRNEATRRALCCEEEP